MLEETIRTKHLERTSRLLESFQLYGDFGWESDLFDSLRQQTDQSDPGAWMPPTLVSDRRSGHNWPLWRTEIELGRLRQRSRIVCQTNSYAEGLLNGLVYFTVGDGGSYQVVSKEKLPDADPNKPGHQDPDWLDKEISRAQDVLDEFCKRNRWCGEQDHQANCLITESRELETCRRMFRDGEGVLRLFHLDNGRTAVRFVDPEQIQQPPGGSERDGWSYGIRHQTKPFEDVETILEYHIAYKDMTVPSLLGEDDGSPVGELVPANEIVLIKAPGTDSTVKRGTSIFHYDTLEALERAAKLQRNASVGAAIRAATAEIWQHAFGTQSQISALSAGLREASRTDPVTGRSENVERIRPGAIRRIPEGQSLVQPVADNTGSYLTGVQGDLRQAASAFNAPEYLASGDASNGNYSSIREAGTPFVRGRTATQGLLKSGYLRVMWRVLLHAAEHGLVDRRALSQIDIQCELTQVVMRDELQRAQEDQILISAGIKSQKTAAMERGLDWDTEEANRAEFEEHHGQGGGGGLPGMDDLGPDDGPDDDGSPPEPDQEPEADDDGLDGELDELLSGMDATDDDDEEVTESRLLEVKDQEGHEHGKDGRFTGSGDHKEAEHEEDTPDHVQARTKDLRRSGVMAADPVRNQKHVDRLAARMVEDGWVGRPLLIVRSDDEWQAWTGSHRLAAAALADLDTVPAVVVNRGDVEDAAEKAGFARDVHPSELDDEQKSELLKHLENPVVDWLLSQELRHGGKAFSEGLLSAADLLDIHLLEAGFTGQITDKAGRKRHYVDGKQVKMSSSTMTPEPSKPKKADEHGERVKKAKDEHKLAKKAHADASKEAATHEKAVGKHGKALAKAEADHEKATGLLDKAKAKVEAAEEKYQIAAKSKRGAGKTVTTARDKARATLKKAQEVVAAAREKLQQAKAVHQDASEKHAAAKRKHAEHSERLGKASEEVLAAQDAHAKAKEEKKAAKAEKKPAAKPRSQPAERPIKSPWEGGTVEHGKVYNAPTEQLQVDPGRFQFKLNTNKEGVTQELLGVKTWNPDFAGVVSVWQDPADGQTYVVNGHHRRELAGRLGVDNLAVRYVQAGSAKEARAVGALINIAEGRGTAVDAAKFMRDMGVSVEDMEKHGVSLKGRLAQDAVVLTRLSDGLFDRLARGVLDPQKAIAVAKNLDNHEMQEQLFRILDKREDEGKDLSMKVVEEMAKEMASTPTTTKTEEGGLFGDWEREESLFVERAEVKAHVRSELAREVGDFTAVSSKKRADRVAVAGNVLDTDTNKQRAEEGERKLNSFDLLVNRKGLISDAVNRAATEMAGAKTKRERDAVKQRALEYVREAIERETNFGGKNQGDGGGTATSGAEPSGGARQDATEPRGGDASPAGVKAKPAAAKKPAKSDSVASGTSDEDAMIARAKEREAKARAESDAKLKAEQDAKNAADKAEVDRLRKEKTAAKKVEPPSAKPSKPAPNPAAMKQIAQDAISEMLHEKYSHTRLIPVGEVREYVRQLHGDAAAGEAFDAALKQWRNEGGGRLVGVDPDKATEAEKRGAIAGIGETLAYIESGEPPLTARSSPLSAAQQKELSKSVDDAVSQLSVKYAHSSGMTLIPIHALRDMIRQKHGDTFARHDSLDDTIKQLWRDDKAILVPISDLQSATSDQLNAAIPGVKNTLFYVQPKAAAKQEEPAKPAKPVVNSSAAQKAVLTAVTDILDSNNMMNLADLKAKLPEMSTQDFHDTLQQLRKDGVLSLGATEGRYGITPEEEAAGIPEEDGLLLWASVKDHGKLQAAINSSKPGKKSVGQTGGK